MNKEQGNTSDRGQIVYYEIEFDNKSPQGITNVFLKPLKIEPPPKDEFRTLYADFKEIEREVSPGYDFRRFYERRVRQENAHLFYVQAQFAKDVTDNYPGFAPFSQYFPSYRLMNYEQLRTYFTWRTKARQGFVADIPLSYAFLYIYELLANIGVSSPEAGLESLVNFWTKFREFKPETDKYVLGWLKDYHIYYELPHSFNDFIAKHSLSEKYPPPLQPDNDFELYRSISKYDIKKSRFYTEENGELIKGAFLYALDAMRDAFCAAGIDFDNALFRPTKKIVPWEPFKNALFYPWQKQKDRFVILFADEIYTLRNNKWFCGTVFTSEKGALFISYMMKKTESLLRTYLKHKYKLSADENMIHPDSLRVLKKAGLDADKIMSDAVRTFFKEATKTVVTVDTQVLEKLRKEARMTTKALTVEEEPGTLPAEVYFAPPVADIFEDDAKETPAPEQKPKDEWAEFKEALTPGEVRALRGVLNGESFKAVADAAGVMAEVFCEGINEKATDILGDNLLDDGFDIYDEYRQKLKETVG